MLCVVALLLTSQVRTTAQTAPETAEQHFALGWKAYERKEYKLAKRELEQATKLKKEYPEAYLGLALVEWAEDRTNGAIKRIDQALEYRPDYAEAHYVRGRLFYVRDDIPQARAAADTAVKLNPKLYAVHALLADLEIAADDFDAAVASFETSRRLAPKEFDASPRLRERYETIKAFLDYKALRRSSQTEFKKPVLLNRPVAHYTRAARENRVAGIVRVLIRINEHGTVDRTLVLTGLPDGLDASAERAVSQLKGNPATLGGVPVASWATVTVKFSIR